MLAVFESVRFFLDRPRLKVLPELTIGVPGVWMRAVVVNVGRRPTTVTEAGFEVLAHGTATLADGRTFAFRRWLKLDGPPKVLAPGELARFEYDFVRDGFPTLVHADFPLRVYARDLRGRFVWGPAAPMIRLIVSETGLRFPRPPDPLMVEPLPGAPLKPRPVYARWKIWHPLGLRDPLPLERRLRKARPRPWEVGGQPETPSEVVTIADDASAASSSPEGMDVPEGEGSGGPLREPESEI